MSIVLSTADAASPMATALATAIGADSILELRTGAAPGPDNAATGTMLCSCPIAGSFTPASNVITSANPAQATPAANGTAAHFRLKTSVGDAILEGTVTVVGGGGDLELDAVGLLTSVPVDLGILAFTVPVAQP